MTSHRYPSKAAGELVRWAKGHGWTWEGYTGNGHLRMVHASGVETTVSATPSDQKAVLATKATMHRLAGTTDEKPRAGKYRKHRKGQPGGGYQAASTPAWRRARDELDNVDGLLEVTTDPAARARLLATRARWAGELARRGQPVPEL